VNLGEEGIVVFRNLPFLLFGGRIMAELEIDVRGQTCPVPLVECRKALKRASPGDIVIVKGTHPASKKEIPMACEALGLEVLGIEDKEEGKEWEIKIRK
jgi:tRNA 2-thiouridine synthesizing protein A